MKQIVTAIVWIFLCNMVTKLYIKMVEMKKK